MRRYELMLVLRPDVPEDRVQAVLDRSTRAISEQSGQIVKVSPWGRRRLAYPIDAYREGSYYIVLFEAPSEAVDELERGLNITEEVMRHLVTRVERPTAVAPSRPPTRTRICAAAGRRGDRGAGRRVHRRVRERGGSGRDRLAHQHPATMRTRPRPARTERG